MDGSRRLKASRSFVKNHVMTKGQGQHTIDRLEEKGNGGGGGEGGGGMIAIMQLAPKPPVTHSSVNRRL